MRVLIVGGGKVGSHLAALLIADGHQICIVEHRSTVLSRLLKELPTEVIMDGDGTRLEVLEMAGIRSSDVLVAVTGEDEVNLNVAMIGRFLFQTPRIIARINNPKNAWLFTPQAGVDVALNQADLLAKLIAEQMSMGDVLTLLKLRQGELSLVTVQVEVGSPAVGRRIAELNLPADCLLVALIREADTIVPRGDTQLQAGDEVLALARSGRQESLRTMLTQAPACETRSGMV